MNESSKTNELIIDAVRSVGDIIRLRLDCVYQQGYANGLKDGKESVQSDESIAYNRGLEDAWELARKLSKLGFNDTRKEIFGEKYGLSINIIKDFTVDEVFDKIKDMPIECDILRDKCPYPGKKCSDCNLCKAFQEAKDMGGNKYELESKDKEND